MLYQAAKKILAGMLSLLLITHHVMSVGGIPGDDNSSDEESEKCPPSPLVSERRFDEDPSPSSSSFGLLLRAAAAAATDTANRRSTPAIVHLIDLSANDDDADDEAFIEELTRLDRRGSQSTAQSESEMRAERRQQTIRNYRLAREERDHVGAHRVVVQLIDDLYTNSPTLSRFLVVKSGDKTDITVLSNIRCHLFNELDRLPAHDPKFILPLYRTWNKFLTILDRRPFERLPDTRVLLRHKLDEVFQYKGPMRNKGEIPLAPFLEAITKNIYAQDILSSFSPEDLHTLQRHLVTIESVEELLHLDSPIQSLVNVFKRLQKWQYVFDFTFIVARQFYYLGLFSEAHKVLLFLGSIIPQSFYAERETTSLKVIYSLSQRHFAFKCGLPVSEIEEKLVGLLGALDYRVFPADLVASYMSVKAPVGNMNLSLSEMLSWTTPPQKKKERKEKASTHHTTLILSGIDTLLDQENLSVKDLDLIRQKMEAASDTPSRDTTTRDRLEGIKAKYALSQIALFFKGMTNVTEEDAINKVLSRLALYVKDPRWHPFIEKHLWPLFDVSSENKFPLRICVTLSYKLKRFHEMQSALKKRESPCMLMAQAGIAEGTCSSRHLSHANVTPPSGELMRREKQSLYDAFSEGLEEYLKTLPRPSTAS